MKIRYHYLFCVLCLSLFFSNCKKDDDVQVIVNVDPEISVSLRENLSDSIPRSLILRLESLQYTSYQNCEYEYTMASDGSTIILKLNGFKVPSDSIIENAKCISLIDLGISQNGIYNIAISLDDVITNNGVITISDDGFTMAIEEDKGLSLEHNEVRRINPKTLWGVINYKNSSEGYIATNFMNGLQILSTTDTIPTGYYGYFSVNANNTINVSDVDTCTYCQSFRFKKNAQKRDIQNFINNYRSIYSDQLSIVAYDSEGNVY
ncbi:MAG: hypothetical protein KBA06_06475 [Saprospiraceae bacterium]|nr:hypothetical protein [Saprospiraceae bacterium]